MSRPTLDTAVSSAFSLTGLSPSLAGFPKTILLKRWITSAVRTPGCTHPGLGSSGSARRYSRNHSYFLFLRLLRCFSSPGSLPYVMDWRMDTGGLLQWVSPFRYLRIIGYVPLPGAFRSLSRLSSALSAKASTICSFMHDQQLTAPLFYGCFAANDTCIALHVLVLGQFFSLFSSNICNHYLFITITSDVLIRYLPNCSAMRQNIGNPQACLYGFLCFDIWRSATPKYRNGIEVMLNSLYLIFYFCMRFSRYVHESF